MNEAIQPEDIKRLCDSKAFRKRLGIADLPPDQQLVELFAISYNAGVRIEDFGRLTERSLEAIIRRHQDRHRDRSQVENATKGKALNKKIEKLAIDILALTEDERDQLDVIVRVALNSGRVQDQEKPKPKPRKRRQKGLSPLAATNEFPEPDRAA